MKAGQSDRNMYYLFWNAHDIIFSDHFERGKTTKAFKDKSSEKMPHIAQNKMFFLQDNNLIPNYINYTSNLPDLSSNDYSQLKINA